MQGRLPVEKLTATFYSLDQITRQWTPSTKPSDEAVIRF